MEPFRDLVLSKQRIIAHSCGLRYLIHDNYSVFHISKIYGVMQLE